MTPEELAAIRQRCEKATRGPWSTAPPQRCSEQEIYSYFIDVELDGSGDVAVLVQSGDSWMDTDKRDAIARPTADFIAHARTDIPALLDEIEGLKIAMDVYNRALHNMSQETLDQRGDPDAIMKDFIQVAREEIDREALCTSDTPPA